MNAKEYLIARQSFLKEIDHAEFDKAHRYLEAAARLLAIHHVRVSRDTVMVSNDVALRLMEMYPDGMPGCFKDVDRGGVISAEILAYWKTGIRKDPEKPERTFG